MAKRFTATEKWRDKWFRKLPAEYKLFWIYLVDECNHAGIWEVDFELANFVMGVEISEENALKIYDGRIKKTGDKWFLPKFIEFQYGVLNPENRAHLSVINILKKEGLYKGLIRPLQGRKDMDKVKELDKDKDKERIATEIYEHYKNNIRGIGSADAKRSLVKLLKQYEKEVLIESIDNYRESLEIRNMEKKFYYQANNFFGTKAYFKDYLPGVYEKPEPKEDGLTDEERKIQAHNRKVLADLNIQMEA